MTIRTRIAPSPTGDPHVGTAYIALFNYAFAKSQGGQFVLRIEDTDQVRSNSESEQQILDAFRWLGLQWDEGPDGEGDCGPYRQSERSQVYQAHCEQLLEAGHAFHCFCTPETLSAMREAQVAAGHTPKYDGRCCQLTEAEVAKRLESGEPHVIRMHVPGDGDCSFVDRLRGEITIPWAQVDMQVLMKTDGLPTYHLANVVDDHLMQITHVIRGEEWIPSAPKHQLLYQYFGWEMPELCHLPLLRNPDQSKLSKRKNPTSILYYRDQGYLPEALLNYLGRMGWSMPDESERFSLDTMLAHFEIDRVSLGGPVFDLEKLSWLNGQWLGQELSDTEYLTRLIEWGFTAEFFSQVLPHLKSRIQVFSEASDWLLPLWQAQPPVTDQMFAETGLEIEVRLQVLQWTLWQFESAPTFDREAVFQAVGRVATASHLKLKAVMPLLFLALSGRTESISAFDLAVLLGPDRTRARLRHALEVQGGVSKKALKRFEKGYQAVLAVDKNGDSH